MNPTTSNRAKSEPATADAQNNFKVKEDQEFDAWLDRELNILVGRWISFATPNSSNSVKPNHQR